MIIKLANNNVKNLQDLGDLSRDEFIEILPESNLSNEQIDSLIMDARNNK
jgi:hypothetical protein